MAHTWARLPFVARRRVRTAPLTSMPSTETAPHAVNIEDARLGYQTAVGLVALTSGEVYSRYGAMLVVQGLLLTVVFDFQQRGRDLSTLAGVTGFLLCIPWLLLLEHGIHSQDVFRSTAARIEQRFFRSTFEIFPGPDEEHLFTKFEPRTKLKALASHVSAEFALRLVIEIVMVLQIGLVLWIQTRGAAP